MNNYTSMLMVPIAQIILIGYSGAFVVIDPQQDKVSN